VCLRTAFTLNTALKQLFLANTGLTSAGAIALAEFLPESVSLLALGLTDNQLDLAAVMALSGGLKANHVMRVLDLSIPPGDEDMARYDFGCFLISNHLFIHSTSRVCREIFNTCVRNTEEAEKASQEATTEVELDRNAVWGMIEKSQLAKTIRQDDAKKVAGHYFTLYT
jgi:protein phosphatase 1 regulatory subunit 37